MPEQRWWHDQPAKHETPPAPAEEPFKTAGYGTFGLILAIVGPFIPLRCRSSSSSPRSSSAGSVWIGRGRGEPVPACRGQRSSLPPLGWC